MATSSNSIAAQSSKHLQSLVDYVLDVKPYHTKVSLGGAVSETYVFSDTLDVNISEAHALRAYLGADLLPDTFTQLGVRQRETFSWWQELISDGVRTTWPMPLFSNPKFASQARLEKFVCGVDDVQEIPGLSTGVFNMKRWDGPGITDVRLNDAHLHDTIDYTLSHGAFSFDIIDTGTTKLWVRTDLADIPAFGGNETILIYNDVKMPWGTLENISGETFEEFKAVCTFGTDSPGYASGITPTTLTIFSSLDDFTTPVGTVDFGDTFTLSNRITFTYALAPHETNETAALGDEWLITPSNRITTGPNTIEETWSLIKSNPIRLVGAPVFTPGAPRTDSPAIEIHTRSIELTPASTWSLTLSGDGKYILDSSLPGYPIEIELVNGCSYKDTNIAFTLIPTVSGWNAGDTFTWEIGEGAAHYKVFGSVSGWQADATVGKWYWNGFIGFKIPYLDYFTLATTSTIAVSEDDGDTWSNAVSNPQVLKSITFANGVFYATGSNSIVAGSTNGYGWTSDIQSIFSPGPNEILLIVGDNGSIATTEDGDTWVLEDSGVSSALHGFTVIPDLITIGPDTYDCAVVVGDGGVILTSVLNLANPMGWMQQTSGTTADLYGAAWSNDAIIVVGANGTILRSEDRITWTPVVSNTPWALRAVVHDTVDDAFIAVGDNGTIVRSTDGGNTWSDLGTFSSGDFTSVAYGNGQFVAVGPDGYIAKSNDGILWTRYSGRPFYSIAFGDGKFVAVGGTLNLQVPFTPAYINTLATNLDAKPSVMMEPSVYTITFTKASDSANSIPAEAKVFNNLTGYGPNLKTGEVWSDGMAAFQIDTILGEVEFNPGDVVKIYVAPHYYTTADLGYDSFPYDTTNYDINSVNLEVPLAYNSELFPLYHAHGAVIIPAAAADDNVIIDKAFMDRVKLKITGATANFPELGAVNDWVPLFFRYHDRVDDTLTPTSAAEFSDLGMFVEAFSAASGQRVFYILSPRFSKTNRASASRLVFDADFFAAYMPFNTKYSIVVEPDQSYGQTIRVKVSENLKVYARIELNFDDIMLIDIDEEQSSFETVAEMEFIEDVNVQFIEAGALPFGGYDFGSYDDYPYDLSAAVVPGFGGAEHYVPALLVGWQEISPGVFDYTGNPNDWVLPQQTTPDSFGTSVAESADATVGSSIAEALSIVMTEESAGALPAGTRHITVIYDFAQANAVDGDTWNGTKGLMISVPGPFTANDVLSVKLLNAPGMPDEWHIAEESDLTTVIKNDYAVLTRTEIDFGIVITDPNSFDIDLSGIAATGPFRLWITTI